MPPFRFPLFSLLIAVSRCSTAWACVAAIFVIAALFHGPSFAQEPQTGDQPRRVVVRFLTEGDFPPFNYLDDDGVLGGFNVDLARALCNEIGAACDIRVRPWDELLVALKRGEADAVIAGHTVLPDALRQVAFTERYFYTPGRFAYENRSREGGYRAGGTRWTIYRCRTRHSPRSFLEDVLP